MTRPFQDIAAAWGWLRYGSLREPSLRQPQADSHELSEFTAGTLHQPSKTITISIKGDKKKESDEYFFVNLSGASGAPIEVGKGEGWIYNDDDTPKPKKSKSQAQLYDAALAELVVGNSGKRRK